VASSLAAALGRSIEPAVTLRFRAGDVRHCYADITRAREQLGFHPRMSLDEGLPELVEWLSTQQADDRVVEATRELVARGLTA
jgi:dTDP-L-rhamnose 4-epimerase